MNILPVSNPFVNNYTNSGKLLRQLQTNNESDIPKFISAIPQEVLTQVYDQKGSTKSFLNSQDFSIILKFMLNIFRNKLDNQNNISNDKIREIIALKTDLKKVSESQQQLTLVQRFKSFLQSKKNKMNDNENKIITSLFMYITNILINRKQFTIDAMYSFCINTSFPVRIDDLFKDFNYQPFIQNYMGKNYIIHFSIFSLAVFLGLESVIIFFTLMGGNPSLQNINYEDSASNLIFWQLLFRKYANDSKILPVSTNKTTKIDQEISNLKEILLQSSNSNSSFKTSIQTRIDFLEKKRKEKSNIDTIIGRSLIPDIDSKKTEIDSKKTEIDQEINYLEALLLKTNQTKNSDLHIQTTNLISALKKKRDQLLIRNSKLNITNEQQQLDQQQLEQQQLKKNIKSLRNAVSNLQMKSQSQQLTQPQQLTQLQQPQLTPPQQQQQPNFMLLYLLDNDKLCRILFFISLFNNGIDLSNMFNVNPMISNQTGFFSKSTPTQLPRSVNNESPLILMCESNLELKNDKYDVYYLIKKFIMFNKYSQNASQPNRQRNMFNFFKNINQASNSSYTPLFKLIENTLIDSKNKIELVQLMLLQGADPNVSPNKMTNLRDLYINKFGNNFLSLFKRYTSFFNSDNWLSENNRILKQQFGQQQFGIQQQFGQQPFGSQPFNQENQAFILELVKEIKQYKSYEQFITDFRNSLFDSNTLLLFKYYIENSNENNINNLFMNFNNKPYNNLKNVLISEIYNKIQQQSSEQFQSPQFQQRRLIQAAGSKIILRTFHFPKPQTYNEHAFRAKKPIIAAENAYEFLKTHYKIGKKLISFIIEDRQKHRKYKYSAETKKNGEIILKSI